MKNEDENWWRQGRERRGPSLTAKHCHSTLIPGRPYVTLGKTLILASKLETMILASWAWNVDSLDRKNI